MPFRKLAAIAVMACAAALGQRVAPPMYTQAYVAALGNVMDLEPADATKLESRLAQNPDDFAARLKLMAYYMRADRVAIPESRTRRAQLAVWLIEHRPDSEILGSPYAIFQISDVAPEQRRMMSGLWDAAVRTHASDARVQWNAAQFYQPIDPDRFLACLEKAVALAPGNPHYGQSLGTLYAGTSLRSPTGGEGRHALAAMDSTGSAFVLEAAVRLFQSEYNRSLMLGGRNSAAGDLAQRYFVRAKALDPSLDEAWILPKLDPQMAGMLAPGARRPESPVGRVESIRRLAPDAFPELPATVASTLRIRGCTIPQPAQGGAPRNVIRGEFLDKGVMDWAVLCSIGGFSSILVFHGEDVEELAKSDDRNYVQDGLYSREIQAVDRKFITTHYRAYGGPEPPPIEHQGVDDMFLQKASTTYYFHQGKWMKFTGSD